MIRRRILLGALLGVLFAAGWWAGRGRASSDLYANTDLFLEILHAVQTSYVDPVDAKPLITGGMRGMVKDLDPYSQYLDSREYQQMSQTLDGEFDGVGLQCDVRDGYPIVVAPIEGSPAWDAGLGPGDFLTKIEDHSTFGMSVPEVASQLRGAAGTSVKVTIVAKGAHEEKDVTLTRRHISVPAVPYAFVSPEHVGYLRLASFTRTAAAEVRSTLDSLRRSGARALVLDLRGDPGGLVDQAVQITQAFVPEGSLIVSTKGRLTTSAHRYVAQKGAAETALPMAVLIDGGTASASEIVSGALQDLDRAVVVGQTSFGKGCVQDIYPLRAQGGAVKLTTAYYYTPSGRSIQRKALKPVADDEGDDEADDSTSTAPAKPAAKTAYHTRMGRTVYGGGGIAPDVEVAGDSTAVRARLGGGLAAVQAALAKDPVYTRAIDIVTHARTPRDVFAALAPAAAPKGAANAAPKPAGKDGKDVKADKPAGHSR